MVIRYGGLKTFKAQKTKNKVAKSAILKITIEIDTTTHESNMMWEIMGTVDGGRMYI